MSIKIKTLRDRCRKGEFIYKLIKDGKKTNYYINANSINNFDNQEQQDISEEYSNAPSWAKIQADKYINIVKEAINLKGEKLEEYISRWNAENPEYKTSYPSIIRMRRRYKNDGIAGLLAKYGAKSNKSTVTDSYFEYFKNLYLVEGAPSLKSCWDSTLGYAMRTFGADKLTFPSFMSFKRRLEKEVPKQSIYLARYGDSAWNRKYGNYIERDYSNIICGKVWVVKYHPNAFIEEWSNLLGSREMFLQFLNGTPITDIQKAVQFYYLITRSFGGRGDTFGTVKKTSGGACKSLHNVPLKIEAIHERLDTVMIENRDFEKLINQYDHEGAFF